jgi:peptidyl-tRNA hydrolase
MSDSQSPERVQARASQEDPIIMYLIVRESLGMGIGKIAAQCAHASQMLLLKFLSMEKNDPDRINVLFAEEIETAMLNKQKTDLFRSWLESSFRKVVLKADDKEWKKIKASMEDEDILVVDAGLTEIEPGSETVIGLFPMRKSLSGKLIKKLQVLK